MTDRRALAAIACLLIGACSRPAPEAGGNAQASPAPAATAAKPPGCSDRIQVTLDRASFIDLGDKPFPARRLAAFETSVASAFHHASNNACKNASVRKALAPLRTLIVQSGSGATEVTFYRAEDRKPAALVFQWAFNEAGLDLPKGADIESGLRCWADPDRKECADMGD
jgi:hypothetical protein